MKKNKFIVGLTLAALVLGMFQINLARAAAVIDMFTTSSNQTSGATTTLTSTWTAIDDIAAGDVITITYGAGATEFDISTANAVSDLTLSVGGAATVAADCTGSELFSSSISGQTLVLTACTEFTGAAAASAVSVALANVTNGLSTGSPHTVSFAGTTYTDTGTSEVPVIDSQTVNITATVDPTIAFNVYTNTEHTPVADNTVSLGSLPIGNTVVAGTDNSTINGIWMDFDTNATNGLNIAVRSENGDTPATAGLWNSVSDTEIAPTTTGQAVVGGTEGFGICFITAGQTSGATATPVSAYNGDGSDDGCSASLTVSGNDHTVGTLTTTDTNIIGATGPISGGYGELAVKAAASSLTAAGAYATTLTFTATGSF